MDYYHIWCDLKDSAKDLPFTKNVRRYLDRLEGERRIVYYRIARRKLGFGPTGLGEFHITIAVRDLAQLDRAFGRVSARRGRIERLHRAVYGAVKNVTFALYRDFPDAARVRRKHREVRR